MRNTDFNQLVLALVIFALVLSGCPGCTATQQATVQKVVTTGENDVHALSTDLASILADVKANKAPITKALTAISAASPEAQKILAPVVTAINGSDLDTAISYNAVLNTATTPKASGQ